MIRFLLLSATVAFTSCVATRERGAGGLTARAQTLEAPSRVRCLNYPPTDSVAVSCQQAQVEVQTYVRRLATLDAVCIEGGFGEVPGEACLARAAVVDTAPGRVLLEIRQTTPGSKWFHQEQTQFWFEEGLLVDLYLAEHGY
jgi:hypothetical protein